MSNSEIKAYLDANIDSEYRDFHGKLVPNIEISRGVRLPVIRQLAKKIAADDIHGYLRDAKLDGYEECMLYGLVIGSLKGGFSDIEPYLTKFIPHIDNWAVCDCSCASLKITTKHRSDMIDYVLGYLDSTKEYEVRFGVVMLMNYFIVDEYIGILLKRLTQVEHNGYYVKMAIAWTISMCYIKDCAKTLSFLQDNKLDDWTHNKAIQKIVESRRVNDIDKTLVKSYKRVKNQEPSNHQ